MPAPEAFMPRARQTIEREAKKAHPLASVEIPINRK